MVISEPLASIRFAAHLMRLQPDFTHAGLLRILAENSQFMTGSCPIGLEQRILAVGLTNRPAACQ